ncbi:MAG: hypothetical protein ACOCWL_03105 [Thermoguttaceae bacterium]
MPTEMIGLWDDLVSCTKFRGRQVKVVVLDEPPARATDDEWLQSLRRMARNGVRLVSPADDSRDAIYEGGE